jgi:hypothetical protein
MHATASRPPLLPPQARADEYLPLKSTLFPISGPNGFLERREGRAGGLD